MQSYFLLSGHSGLELIKVELAEFTLKEKQAVWQF